MVGVVVVVVGVGDLKEPEEKVIQIIQLMVAEGEVPPPPLSHKHQGKYPRHTP